MTVRRQLVRSLGLAALSGAPAHAECLGSGCYDGLVLILLLGVLGVVAVIGLVIFAMVKLGFGWLVKWLIGAAILIAVVPPLIVSVLHDRKLAQIEALDFVGPLPRMADRTPLIVLYSADSRGCNFALDPYIEARSLEGVLVLETWPLEDQPDFTQLVALADLALQQKVTKVTRITDDPNIPDGYDMQETVNRLLTPAERRSAAADVDYLIFAQCYGYGEVYKALRTNPALKGTTEPFHVDLAMAPLPKGSGVLSVRDLTFDLLDLSYDGVTEGFLFTSSRHGGATVAPYDPAALEASLCVEKDWTATADCNP